MACREEGVDGASVSVDVAGGLEGRNGAIVELSFGSEVVAIAAAFVWAMRGRRGEIARSRRGSRGEEESFVCRVSARGGSGRRLGSSRGGCDADMRRSRPIPSSSGRHGGVSTVRPARPQTLLRVHPSTCIGAVRCIVPIYRPVVERRRGVPVGDVDEGGDGLAFIEPASLGTAREADDEECR